MSDTTGNEYLDNLTQWFGELHDKIKAENAGYDILRKIDAAWGAVSRCKKRDPIALDDLIELVKSGNADAMYELADTYLALWEHESGVEELEARWEKAVEWYKLAAEHGQPKAMFWLGNTYYYTIEETRDCEKALHWIIKAADLGNLDALILLGGCCPPFMYEQMPQLEQLNEKYRPIAIEKYQATYDGKKQHIIELMLRYGKRGKLLTADIPKFHREAEENQSAIDGEE